MEDKEDVAALSQMVGIIQKYIGRTYDKITVADFILQYSGGREGQFHQDMCHQAVGAVLNVGDSPVSGTEFLEYI